MPVISVRRNEATKNQLNGSSSRRFSPTHSQPCNYPFIQFAFPCLRPIIVNTVHLVRIPDNGQTHD